MHYDFLIIGQGIAGTLLSFQLLQAGKSVLVIDTAGRSGNSSSVAGAVINPFAGKKGAPVAGHDFLLPAARTLYKEMEVLMGRRFWYDTPMLVFHEHLIQQAQFQQNSEKFPGSILSLDPDEQVPLQQDFNIDFGVHKVTATVRIDAAALLSLWRNRLQADNCLWEELFDPQYFSIGQTGIHYKDVTADKIIFCEGAAALANPLWQALPFTPNRGDVLLLSIPGLDMGYLYHKSLRLIPRQDGLFWCGSNYRWNFDNLQPDREWRQDAVKKLSYWLRLPFSIEAHQVAERPTTAGQQVFAGTHPEYEQVILFNGLGTRGFSIGPYWARRLGQWLCGEADSYFERPGYSGIRGIK